MFAIATGILPQLAQAFIGGDDDLLGKLLEHKIEELGKGVLANILPGDPLKRVASAIETGGVSELNRMRNQWLSAVTPAPLPGQGFLNRVTNTFEQNKHLLTRPEGKWQKWSKSRREWLDETYRHDWRTQPRDPHGRWKEGRLRFPYVPKTQRRLRRAARRMARAAIRQAVSGTTKPGNWRTNRRDWLNGN